jgi:hypothetical protein
MQRRSASALADLEAKGIAWRRYQKIAFGQAEIEQLHNLLRMMIAPYLNWISRETNFSGSRYGDD